MLLLYIIDLSILRNQLNIKLVLNFKILLIINFNFYKYTV